MRHTLAAGTALLCLVALGCAKDKESGSTGNAPVALSGTVNDHGTKEAGSEIEVEQDDFYFGPTFIKAKAGSTVKIELSNETSNPHTFTIDGTSVDQTVQPGAKADVSVTLPASGALRFYCKFHAGQGMQGAIFSQEGDTLSGGGGSSATPSSTGDGGAYEK